MIDPDYIRHFPTVLDMIHESCFRSYQILEAVKIMIAREDSMETISDFIKHCEKDIEENGNRKI